MKTNLPVFISPLNAKKKYYIIRAKDIAYQFFTTEGRYLVFFAASSYLTGEKKEMS
jgi:hypothetical protein